MAILQQLEPIINNILSSNDNIKLLFNKLFDKCLKISKTFNDGATIYQCSISMLDKTNLTTKQYEKLLNSHIAVAIDRIIQYKNKNKLPAQLVKKIEKQAFGKKQPDGTIQLKGLLKSVLLDNKMAVITPYIDIDEAHNAAALQVAWASPNNDTILKAGYLVVYGDKFPNSKGKLFSDYSIINDNTIGITPNNFSHLIKQLHKKILEIDGEKTGFNFFEKLVNDLIMEVGSDLFLQKLQEFANYKNINLTISTTQEAIQTVLASKKNYNKFGIQKIPDNINIDLGLELLYPFAPILQALWLNKRQDYGYIDGVLLYKTNTFISPKTSKPIINAKFKIMVAGTITYILCSDNRENNYIASMSDSGCSTSIYSMTINNINTSTSINTTIDNLLANSKKANDFFRSGEIFQIQPNLIPLSMGLPIAKAYTFNDMDIENIQPLSNKFSNNDIITVHKCKKKGTPVLSWGEQLTQNELKNLVPYLKIIPGQNLSITDKNDLLLFTIQNNPSDNETSLKLIKSLGKAIIAYKIKGLQKILVDN